MSALFPPPQTRTIGKVNVGGRAQPLELDIAWFLYLTQGLYERAGGPLGSSTADLEAAAFEDAGIEELKLAIYRLTDQVGEMASEINSLRERLTVAYRQLQDINEGQAL
jgi:hypothetical protein